MGEHPTGTGFRAATTLKLLPYTPKAALPHFTPEDQMDYSRLMVPVNLLMAFHDPNYCEWLVPGSYTF